MSILIQRQPVLNRHKAITASRLLLHAETCAEAVAELKRLSADWPNSRNVFLNFGQAVLDDTLLDWDAPKNIMLEIPATQFEAGKNAQLLEALTARHVSLCLDGYTQGSPLPAGCNFRYLLADVGQAPQPLNAPGLLLAKDLHDTTAFETAIENGYAGATGWFFRAPNKPPRADLNPSHANIIRLLNLVRNNADMKEIEAALKRDVTLAFKLLRYMNSAGMGALVEVNTFRQAVSLLGYDKLHRWLSLLLVNASEDPIAPALMQTAVVRGRFMEVMGAGLLPKSEQDNLFITGAFSVLELLLGTRLDVIFQHLSLPESIQAALLRNEGPIAQLLNLALTCEGGSKEALQAQLDSLGLTAQNCNLAQVDAMSFADKLQFN